MERVASRIAKIEKKYLDLVWLAERVPEDEEKTAIHDRCEAIRKQYPKESAVVAEGGEWETGFDCGMLATARLLKAYANKKACSVFIAKSESRFPDSDA